MWSLLDSTPQPHLPLPLEPRQYSTRSVGEKLGVTEGKGWTVYLLIDCSLIAFITEKGQPPAATGPGADGQPTPPWITMARQKRRGAPDLPVNQEDKPGSRILKTETGKQTQVWRENTISVELGAGPGRGRGSLAGCSGHLRHCTITDPE